LAEGVQLSARVVSPRDAANAPGVVILAQPTDAGFRAFAQGLARRGFVVAIVDVRGAGGSTRQIVNGASASLIFDAEAAAGDARALARWLSGLPGVDAERLALIGVWMTAPLVLDATSVEPPYAAAALVFPTVPPADHPLGALARRSAPARVLVVDAAPSRLPPDVAGALKPPTRRVETSARDLVALADDTAVMDSIAAWLLDPDAARI
jgi:dienelactone hydrolase